MEAEKRREEQRDFGVFFDDDYNYLQHLKEASAPSELVVSGAGRRSVNFLDQDGDKKQEAEESRDIPVSSNSPFTHWWSLCTNTYSIKYFLDI